MSESGVSLDSLWISSAIHYMWMVNRIPKIAMQYMVLGTTPLKYISSSTPEGRTLSFLRNFSFPPNL